MSYLNNTGIDIFAGPSPNNFDEVRGRFLLTKGNISRDSSMSSTKSSIAYHKKMECNNIMVVDNKIDNISSTLSYKTDQEKALQVSKAAEQQVNTRFKHGNLVSSESTLQCILNKQQHSNPTCGQATQNNDEAVINIQLPYDLHVPMEPELWDGNFHPISLYRSIEHIVLDTKNIKDTLKFMARYISNKQVDSSKPNNLKDFNSIGKAIWNFISLVYQAIWDFLYTDKQSNSLRRKVAAKFTLKIQPTSGKNNKDINKPTLEKEFLYLSLLNLKRKSMLS